MKYCPKCKLRMPSEATVCQKCNGALRTVGTGGASEAASTDAAVGSDLTMQLQGLQHEVRRSRATMRIAGVIAIALLALLMMLLVGLRVYDAMQYAEVSEADVRLGAGAAGEAEIRFVRRNAGKVEFVRETAGRTETLIDHGRQTASESKAETSFVWSGSDSGDFTIRLRARKGWSTAENVWKARDGKVQRVE